MSSDDQSIKWCRNTAANFNRLSRVHERYRQIDDGRQTDRQTDRRTDGRTTTYVSSRSLKMEETGLVVTR